MMSLYAQCMAERYGYEVIETEFGFVTFKIVGTLCTAIEVFVRESVRGQRHWRDLWEHLRHVCVDRGVTTIRGFVDLTKDEPTKRLTFYFRLGAEVKEAVNNVVIVEWKV